MQKANAQPIRTFSIGFRDNDYNEAPFARRIAEHLGTDHTELTVTPGDALAVIPKLPEIYDEPFADSSQIPTYLVSRLAREKVTVSLSGDGGDELFGGYTHYPRSIAYWQQVKRIPAPLRAVGRAALSRMPLAWVKQLSAPLTLAGPWRRQRQLPDRIKERSAHVFARSFPEIYRELVSGWHWPQEVVLGANEPDTVHTRASEWPVDSGFFGHMMYMDTRQYLPDDILVKVDRAAMAVSLESRVPFLDHHVAAAAWATPLSIHRRDGSSKWVLRQLLARHVPRALFERPKAGFSIPLARWLRRDLRPWADDLLAESRLRRQGIFDPAVIMRRWQQHRDGLIDWSVSLWSVLMFEAWLDRWETAQIAGNDTAKRAAVLS
jgi:asparagine synthase (glutamine-hydrolysing)